MLDFSFQGKIYLAPRLSSGKPGAGRWVDDASQFQIQMSLDTEERQESYSGNRLTSVRLPKAKKANFTLVLNAMSAQNFAMSVQGTATDVAAGTVTGEELPAGLVADDIVCLDYPRISSLVLTDSAGTPAMLAEDTNYGIESAPGGLLKIIDPASLTQPFKAAYSYAAHINLVAFSVPAIEKYLILDGINTVDNERIRLLVYRCSFDPVESLDLITDSLGNLTLKGAILYDSINGPDANLGGFASVQLPAAA